MKPVAEGQMIGHAQLIFDRLQRLHASMRARGASEEAIARLPRLPTYEEPFELAPVLLGRRPRKLQATSRLKGKRAKRQRVCKSPGRLEPGRGHLEPGDGALKRDIVAAVAAAAGIVEHAITAKARTANTTPARHIAWYLMRELSGLSTVAIAMLFDVSGHTTILHGLRQVRRHLEAGRRWAGVYREARDRLTAAGDQDDGTHAESMEADA